MDNTDYRIEVDGDREDAYDVRFAVFVEEQGVDPAIEIDEHEDTATHFVAYADDEPVGATRLREPEDGIGKVERLAVLGFHRGQGLGRQLMDAVEAEARREGLERLTLHGQVRVVEFYEHLGYEQESDEFEEAGITHVKMAKSIDRAEDSSAPGRT
ncbi:phospholipiddiacylglycerol acyltransferase protein [Halorhabdus tiamatea SARL4B]|uniref:GCN5-related N-acetyltransfrase n=1 Tax=Halorhabdus tiamatea SARL4B TaxID=1033806 RepID=F7PN23_9EURY|nr:GNAT family N-acetyltransferase [Halorhabdus tiamatea]ERJ07734.1 phospholipiddiacylglycerol acyltransferase protein [Halorhabdus tiamatea SARL4B]CCQ32608.1 GCN5-related N-acetyltransfrase [Halorhabdus tiamatea SARL4B]